MLQKNNSVLAGTVPGTLAGALVGTLPGQLRGCGKVRGRNTRRAAGRARLPLLRKTFEKRKFRGKLPGVSRVSCPGARSAAAATFSLRRAAAGFRDFQRFPSWNRCINIAKIRTIIAKKQQHPSLSGLFQQSNRWTCSTRSTCSINSKPAQTL